MKDVHGQLTIDSFVMCSRCDLQTELISHRVDHADIEFRRMHD